MELGLHFSFYIDEEWKNNSVNKMHLYCLKHYKDIFDSVTFYIIVNDLNDKKLIQDFQREIVDIGFSKLSFVPCQNTMYREAKPFYDYIVKKMDKIEDIIMWGHNKGITNVTNSYYDKNSVLNWIVAMYFQNLEYVADVKKEFVDYDRRFFGAFLTDVKERNETKYGYLYGGEFFWMYARGVSFDAFRGKISNPLDIPFAGRGYAEKFPGNLYDFKVDDTNYALSTHYSRIFNWRIDYYKNAKMANEFICREDIDKYNNFFNEVMSNCGYE